MCACASFSNRSFCALPACETPDPGPRRKEPGRERRPEGVFHLAQVPHDADVEEAFVGLGCFGGLRGLVDDAGLLPVAVLQFVEAGLLEHDQAGRKFQRLPWASSSVRMSR